MLTHSRLLDLLDYDPDTGWFVNKIDRPRAPKGVRAGSPSGHGYRKISIDCLKYYEHQLAWFYVHSEWPDEIDHVDRNGSNNIITNLRLCTRSQNNSNKNKNGSSGLAGAYYNYRDSYWYSKIQVNGVVKWLGTFGSALEAHIMYTIMSEFYYGEFSHATRGN